MRKQVAIRLDIDLYKEIKVMLVNEDKTFQEYLESLIKKDLKERGDDNEQKENY